MRKRTEARNHPLLLLVEGDDDKRLVPELVELGIGNGFQWERDGQHIVHIHIQGGVESLLAPGTIAAHFSASGREALGVVIDADHPPTNRWNAIRSRLLADSAMIGGIDASGLPETPPEHGFITEVDEDAPGGPRRLGVWIMPDNRQPGMLETLALSLITEGKLLDLAKQSCTNASGIGAPFKVAHLDKAVVHTWLAWQDPPGRQLHNAITEKMLDPRLPLGQAFIDWFRKLFRV
jgi:hypothetical protein